VAAPPAHPSSALQPIHKAPYLRVRAAACRKCIEVLARTPSRTSVAGLVATRVRDHRLGRWRAQVPASVIEAAAGPADLRRFRQYALRSYVEDNRKLTWCARRPRSAGCACARDAARRGCQPRCVCLLIAACMPARYTVTGRD